MTGESHGDQPRGNFARFAAAHSQHNEPDHPRRVVVGNLGRIPVEFVLTAVDLAQARQAQGLSEAHLVYAALERSRDLVSLLVDLAVPVPVVRDYIATHLEVDAPPSIDIVQQADGKREVYRYGMVDVIEGRSMVLAATPAAHSVDAVDIFVAALFDPKSLTTYATSAMAGVDRAQLLVGIRQRLSRYDGVEFPPTRTVDLSAPTRIRWSRRDKVVRTLQATESEDAYWTYVKIGDEMLLYVESDTALDQLRAERLIDTDPTEEPGP